MNCKSPHVITVATNWTPTFENFKRSLHINGYSYKVLGWGEKWKGWRWRAKLYRNYLREIEASDKHAVVIILDAYDVLVARKSDEFPYTFQAFKRPIVIGCEWWCASAENCGNVLDWWSKNSKKKAFRSRINAGCVTGYATSLLKMYEWILTKNYEDDQLGIASWINLYGHDSVALDSGSAIIYNSNVFDGMRFLSSAFFHHFPGPLLKLGLFPLYNNSATKILGTYARKQYPPFQLEALIWCLVLYSILSIFLHSSFKR